MPRIVVPRHSSPYGGVDHGADGTCLVDLRDEADASILRLVWFGGSFHCVDSRQNLVGKCGVVGCKGWRGPRRTWFASVFQCLPEGLAFELCGVLVDQ